jgi:nitrite reductase/ring-hydroxylating ferredoxin subunit
MRSRVSLGSFAELIPGHARIIALAGGRSVIVVLSKEGVRAFMNECKHLPTPLNVYGEDPIVDGALLCRSHGARYTLEEGMCFSGPCRGKFLDAVHVDRQGDQLSALVEIPEVYVEEES